MAPRPPFRWGHPGEAGAALVNPIAEISIVRVPRRAVAALVSRMAPDPDHAGQSAARCSHDETAEACHGQDEEDQTNPKADRAEGVAQDGPGAPAQRDAGNGAALRSRVPDATRGRSRGGRGGAGSKRLTPQPAAVSLTASPTPA